MTAFAKSLLGWNLRPYVEADGITPWPDGQKRETFRAEVARITGRSVRTDADLLEAVGAHLRVRGVEPCLLVAFAALCGERPSESLLRAFPGYQLQFLLGHHLGAIFGGA